MKTHASLAILLTAGAFGLSVAANAQDQVLVKFEVYRVKGSSSGKLSLTDNIWTGLDGERLEAGKGPFSFFTLADLTVAAVRFKADETGWTWNEEALPPPTSGVSRVAAPQVIQLVGRSFEMSVSPSEPIEYFEEREDGLFEHRISNEAPGISVSTRIEAGADGRIVLRKLTLETKTVTEREPIRGVGLPVGRPLFASERIETTISLKPDRDYGIQVATKSEGILILRVRVERSGASPR